MTLLFALSCLALSLDAQTVDWPKHQAEILQHYRSLGHHRADYVVAPRRPTVEAR